MRSLDSSIRSWARRHRLAVWAQAYVSEIYRLLDTVPGVDFVRGWYWRDRCPARASNRDELVAPEDHARQPSTGKDTVVLDADPDLVIEVPDTLIEFPSTTL